MTGSDGVFDGSIPEIYDRYLVPLIFEQYADDLARRTAAVAPDAVLEVAAGSGVVTRAAAAVLDSAVRYVASDLNAPMLDRAASMQPDPDRIEWQPADAGALPFDDETFDLVLCQFGVMFLPDRIGAYAEARRVLRTGGTLVFNTWDRIEENEFADTVTAAMAERFSHAPPRFLARTPHGHYDTARHRTELAAAGFSDVGIDVVQGTSVASSPEIPAIAYCMGTPLRTEIEALDPAGVGDATEQATNALAGRFGKGRISGRVRGFVMTAN